MSPRPELIRAKTAHSILMAMTRAWGTVFPDHAVAGVIITEDYVGFAGSADFPPGPGYMRKAASTLLDMADEVEATGRVEDQGVQPMNVTTEDPHREDLSAEGSDRR